MAGQAPAVPPTFHPHLIVMAQSGRTVVPGPDRQSYPPRRIPQRERPHHRDRGLPESQQRQPKTIHLDRHRRADPCQGRPRTGHPPASVNSIMRHYTSRTRRGARYPRYDIPVLRLRGDSETSRGNDRVSHLCRIRSSRPSALGTGRSWQLNSTNRRGHITISAHKTDMEASVR